MRRWIHTLAVLAGLALTGCGAPAGPVIDDLEMPDSAHLGTDGFYRVEGLLSFHDDAGAVNKIRILVPAPNSANVQTYEFDASPGLSHGTLPLVVKFSSLSPRGPLSYEVSLVDLAGSSSTPRPASVVLQ